MRYLLDTNIASHIIKGDIPRVRERLAGLPMESIVISAVTEAELRYGVAKRGHPVGLVQRVGEFLIRVEILPWTSEVAEAYGNLRAASEAAGISLDPLDMMIAAHARAVDAILVTRDRAFARLPGNLPIEDWTAIG
jgi:tRNA(fMet)-specific endonuclease VapC